MSRAPRDRVGATRGKLALVAVLAVVLIWVLASNFRGSASEPAPRESQNAEQPESVALSPEPRPRDAVLATSPFGEFAADDNWPDAPETKPDFDPLALPAWMASAAIAGPTDDASRHTLEQIQQAQNAIIFVTAGQRVARIGDRDYHVGDMVGQYQITDISSAGIVLAEPTRDSTSP